jgi:hypothetical protein
VVTTKYNPKGCYNLAVTVGNEVLNWRVESNYDISTTQYKLSIKVSVGNQTTRHDYSSLENIVNYHSILRPLIGWVNFGSCDDQF